jgi:hypothetical protein
MQHDGASSWGSHLALPDQSGWLAVLQAEEQRVRRYGGTHGLVLIRLDDPVNGRQLEVAAAAIASSVRDIDFLALVDRHTFAVLALHCEDLTSLVGRLRHAFDYLGLPGTTLIDARPGGGDLRTVWEAMIGALPAGSSRQVDFVASAPPSLN